MGGPPAQRQILSGCGRRSGCGGGVFGLVAEAAQEAFYGDVFVEGLRVSGLSALFGFLGFWDPGRWLGLVRAFGACFEADCLRR